MPRTSATTRRTARGGAPGYRITAPSGLHAHVSSSFGLRSAPCGSFLFGMRFRTMSGTFGIEVPSEGHARSGLLIPGPSEPRAMPWAIELLPRRGGVLSIRRHAALKGRRFGSQGQRPWRFAASLHGHAASPRGTCVVAFPHVPPSRCPGLPSCGRFGADLCPSLGDVCVQPRRGGNSVARGNAPGDSARRHTSSPHSTHDALSRLSVYVRSSRPGRCPGLPTCCPFGAETNW